MALSFVSDSVENITIESFNFDTSLSILHGRFHMAVLRKLEDKDYIEFINVMYKIDSEIIPESSNEIRFKNFIRMKVLQRFYKEGLITFINVVPDEPE